MSNFFIYLNNLVYRLLNACGLRHQNRRWGIIYDSVNKQPLDPVIVKLIDAQSGKVSQTCVTDLDGRYNFLAYPGKFKILVKKSNYVFPSIMSAGEKDEIYNNLYHGEFFELRGSSDVIPFNIPMDPEAKDWNQGAKEKMVDFHPYAENLLNRFIAVLFWFVLILALLAWYTQPSTLSYVVLGFYLFIFLLLLLPRPRWWGRVRFKSSGAPAKGLVLELSYFQMPQVIVARANIYEDGKFFLRIDPGKYFMQIKRYSETNAPVVVYEKAVRVGSEHVINRNFAI